MSPRRDWQLITKWTKRVGVALVFAFALTGWSLAISRGTEVDNLTTAQARSRPIVDYTVARNAQQDCLQSYTFKFNADIADALLTDRADTAAVDRAKAEITADRDADRMINQLCPAPTPPTFDAKGKVATSATIPALHPAPDPTG